MTDTLIWFLAAALSKVTPPEKYVYKTMAANFNQTPNLNLESWLCISLFTLDHNLSFLDRKILHMHMEKRWALQFI